MLTGLSLLIAGLLISMLVMSTGIGGGIFWTPLLILAYNTSPQEAVATSLLIQSVGLGSGVYAYMKSGMIEFRLAALLFITALPGIIVGSLITVRLSGDSVQLALGIMAIILAILFVSQTEESRITRQFTFKKDRKKVIRILPLPAFLGILMGALSTGISEWLIPVLRNRLKLSMQRAIATMICVMFLLALTASALHWSFSGNIQMDKLLWGGAGVMIGAQIGASITRYLDERLLKDIFIYLMTLIGIHLVFQAV